MASTDTTRDAAQLAADAFAAVDSRDVDRVAALWHDDIAEEFLALGLTVNGKAALRGFFTELFTAVPDLRMEVLRITSEGDVAWIHWRMTGTHTGGPYQGIEPTGRSLDLQGADCMEFADGLLLRNTVFYDSTSFARQVGMLPPQDSAADKAMLGAFNAVTKARARLKRS